MSKHQREDLMPGREHLTVTGKFQSDKYEWCPAGFVPLKVGDPMCQDLLHNYAERRRVIDPAFSDDLAEALSFHQARNRALSAPPRATNLQTFGLTPRQVQALAVITDYIADEGHSPTYDEIAAGLGISTKSSVHRLVKGLEERGRIRLIHNRSRSIEGLS